MEVFVVILLVKFGVIVRELGMKDLIVLKVGISLLVVEFVIIFFFYCVSGWNFVL